MVQFGEMLHTNKYVLGFRRVAIWGRGRAQFKPGWWWTMDVMTNYNATDLGSAYREYWKCPYVLFVEVIDNRGRNE